MSNPTDSNKSVHPDPYAGQYPPPPPLSSESLDNSLIKTKYSQSQPSSSQPEPFYLIDQSSSSNRKSLSSSQGRQSFHEENNSVTLSSSQSLPESSSRPYDKHRKSESDYDDPHAVSLKEYLYAEREEKIRQQQLEDNLKHQQIELENSLKQQPSHVIDIHEDYKHPPPIRESYYSPIHEEPYPFHPPLLPSPPHILSPPLPITFLNPQPTPPFLNPQPTSPPFQSSPFLNPPSPFFSPFHQGTKPSLLPPFPPPQQHIHEKYNEDHAYCRDISCCSCLVSSIAALFLSGGLVMIIIAKVMGDKCELSDYKSMHSSLCQPIFHSGVLYGGVALAALATLVIVGKLLKCLLCN